MHGGWGGLLLGREWQRLLDFHLDYSGLHGRMVDPEEHLVVLRHLRLITDGTECSPVGASTAALLRIAQFYPNLRCAGDSDGGSQHVAREHRYRGDALWSMRH